MIIFLNEDSNYVTFSSNKMGINTINLNINHLDDNNFNTDDVKTFFLTRIHSMQG